MEFTEQLKNCLQEGGAIEWDGAAISIRRDKWGSCPTITKWFNGKTWARFIHQLAEYGFRKLSCVHEADHSKSMCDKIIKYGHANVTNNENWTNLKRISKKKINTRSQYSNPRFSF